MTMRWLRLGALAAALFVGTGCFEPRVTRVVDGREHVGRYISPYAYTLYGYARVAEAHGDLEAALINFEAAADEDPKSMAIWTRIGAVRCALDLDAESAFNEAERIDPAFAPLWHERAACALSHSRASEAVSYARRAVSFDPRWLDARLLFIEALTANGDTEAAWRDARALTVELPLSSAAWRARVDTAKRARQPDDALVAAARLRRLSPKDEEQLANDFQSLDVHVRLDLALRNGNVEKARALARQARLSVGELAARAALVGSVELAVNHGRIAVLADPTDRTARIALLAAADMRGDADAAKLALATPAPSGSAPLSASAKLLMAELLARRIGRDAAQDWIAAAGPGPHEGDAKQRWDALARSDAAASVGEASAPAE